MRKVSEEFLLEVEELIDKSNDAINNLERLGNNKRIYLDLKKRLQNMSDKLKSQYGLALSEYKDINARNKWLEKEKEDSGQ